MRQRQRRNPPGRGLGVDISGGPVVDPTENVLALVDVEKAHQHELRVLESRYQDAMRKAETRRVNERIEAQTIRVNELAAQKMMFDLEIAKILRTNQDAASTLLATQLKEVKNDLSDRTAKLEQFRWESGGKFSGANALWGYIIGIAGILIAGGVFLSHGR
jgi:hypothetical protein